MGAGGAGAAEPQARKQFASAEHTEHRTWARPLLKWEVENALPKRHPSSGELPTSPLTSKAPASGTFCVVFNSHFT